MVDPRDPLRAGTVVHQRYRVESLLGTGGFGATYLVADMERFGHRCALKELQAHDSGFRAKAMELFEREARVLLTLKHPRIPSLQAYFPEDGRYFLVQDYIEGGTYHDYVRQHGPLSEAAVRSLLVDVLDVLEYLHSRQPAVLHRDIKPSNLIRGPDERPYLIDFGAVREALDRADPASSMTAIGSRGFAPEEQTLGHAVPSSDLYALAATAIALATDTSPEEWRDRVSGVVTIPDTAPLGPELRAVLTRMLAPVPNRFPSAAEVRRALGDAAPSAAGRGIPATGLDRPAGPALAPTEVEPGKTPIQLSGRRNGSIWSRWQPWAGGIAVASLAVVGWVVLRGSGVADPPIVPDSLVTVPPAVAPSAPILDAHATLTRAGVVLSVDHPAAWRRVTTEAQDHIGLEEPSTSGVFLTGLDRTQVSVEAFAQQWADRLGRLYGTISLEDAGSFDTAQSYWRFGIVTSRGANRRGVLIVEEPPGRDPGRALRWWALLGQTEQTIPTALRMAASLGVRAEEPAPE